jgi:hypothetical protein
VKHFLPFLAKEVEFCFRGSGCVTVMGADETWYSFVNAEHCSLPPSECCCDAQLNALAVCGLLPFIPMGWFPITKAAGHERVCARAHGRAPCAHGSVLHH